MIIKIKTNNHSKEPGKNTTFSCKDTAEEALKTFIKQLSFYGFTDQEISQAIQECHYYV